MNVIFQKPIDSYNAFIGRQALISKIYARVVRIDNTVIGCEFAEHDFVAEAIIQDLMFYQRRNRRDKRTGAAATNAEGGLGVPATVEQNI